jgi:hypothetical protein
METGRQGSRNSGDKKIIVSQKSREKKIREVTRADGKGRKKEGKKFNLVFVIFLLCKTNL